MKNKNSTEFLKLDNRYMGVDFTASLFLRMRIFIIKFFKNEFFNVKYSLFNFIVCFNQDPTKTHLLKLVLLASLIQ